MAGVEDLEALQVEAKAPVTVTQEAESARPRHGAPLDLGSDVVVGPDHRRYQSAACLGRAGWDRVFLARHIVIGRSVALKIVVGGRHPRFDSSPRPARYSPGSTTPNIVQLYEFGEYGAGLIPGAGNVDGDTLRDRMRAGRIEADDALRYARAIAEALAHAHAASRASSHCDVKRAT